MLNFKRVYLPEKLRGFEVERLTKDGSQYIGGNYAAALTSILPCQI